VTGGGWVLLKMSGQSMSPQGGVEVSAATAGSVADVAVST